MQSEDKEGSDFLEKSSVAYSYLSLLNYSLALAKTSFNEVIILIRILFEGLCVPIKQKMLLLGPEKY